MSGWWSSFSAIPATLFTKAIAAPKSRNLNSLRSRGSPSTSDQPGTAWKSSRTRLSGSGASPRLQGTHVFLESSILHLRPAWAGILSGLSSPGILGGSSGEGGRRGVPAPPRGTTIPATPIRYPPPDTSVGFRARAPGGGRPRDADSRGPDHVVAQDPPAPDLLQNAPRRLPVGVFQGDRLVPARVERCPLRLHRPDAVLGEDPEELVFDELQAFRQGRFFEAGPRERVERGHEVPNELFERLPLPFLALPPDAVLIVQEIGLLPLSELQVFVGARGLLVRLGKIAPEPLDLLPETGISAWLTARFRIRCAPVSAGTFFHERLALPRTLPGLPIVGLLPELRIDD